jgi:prevent-host-death family protein
MTIMYSRRRPRGSRVREPGSPVSATTFKAQCLELMDYVHDTGREVVVTKHGKPVAKLVPVTVGSQDFIGCLRGTVTYHGDIVAPTGETWEADA